MTFLYLHFFVLQPQRHKLMEPIEDAKEDKWFLCRAEGWSVQGPFINEPIIC